MHNFHIPSMTCGGCLGAVTKAIQKLDPQAHIEGDLENHTVAVASDRPEASLLAALENAGYPAKPVSDDR
jgi:copper chaperone